MSVIGQQIIAEVRKIAAEQPDHVYDRENCWYLDPINNEPACIMGKALANLGLLPPWAGEDHASFEGKGIDKVLDILGIDADLSEKLWLVNVQQAQDGRTGEIQARKSWGESVQYADGQVLIH